MNVRGGLHIRLRLCTIISSWKRNWCSSSEYQKTAYIVSVARTAIGSYGGALKDYTAPQLGGMAIRRAVEVAKVDKSKIDEIFFGNVLSAGVGQAPAKQACMAAGLADTIPCTTVNKVCSSGLKSTVFGVQSIQLGLANIVVVGGMESMTKSPYYIDRLRFGARMGDVKAVDSMIHDGLWDPYEDFHMGMCGEHCAEELQISRAEQDNYATKSYSRAAKATQLGSFKNEIVPITLSDGTVFDSDEEVKRFKEVDRLGELKTVFKKQNGTVTAGNSSKLSDGAAALVLASGQAVREYGLKPVAKIISYADGEQAPIRFPTTPAKAVKIALERAKLATKDVDFWEINEAFSVVAVANCKLLDLNPEHVNIYGGAVSLGHPIGASGARILVTLTSVLQQTSGSIGVAAICNGGGGATCVVIERTS
ncbi:hypothetical protein GpartN1_g4448.t1 [Galdieria partita]|uniref:Acetyl-CoA C-acetyltransferase n=1 Tax=Galdieria partita TaxID=83374 RepID=A0A9C7Q016_9RHOD|nr:hypothetical protein GpartN1_g4448.t1 [Galdieria partita]